MHAVHLRCLVGGRRRTAGLVGDDDQVAVVGRVQPIDDPTQANAFISVSWRPSTWYSSVARSRSQAYSSSSQVLAASILRPTPGACDGNVG